MHNVVVTVAQRDAPAIKEALGSRCSLEFVAPFAPRDERMAAIDRARLFLIDPQSLRSAPETLAFSVRQGVPFVVWASSSEGSLSPLLEALSYHPLDMVFAAWDLPARLECVSTITQRRWHGMELARMLTTSLGALRADFGLYCLATLCAATPRDSVAKWSAVCNMSVSTAGRRLSEGGLGSPHKFLAAAGIAASFDHTSMPESPRPLRRAIANLTSISVHEMDSGMPRSEVLQRVAASVCQHTVGHVADDKTHSPMIRCV